VKYVQLIPYACFGLSGVAVGVYAIIAQWRADHPKKGKRLTRDHAGMLE
jgi:hypothetical protein